MQCHFFCYGVRYNIFLQGRYGFYGLAVQRIPHRYNANGKSFSIVCRVAI